MKKRKEFFTWLNEPPVNHKELIKPSAGVEFVAFDNGVQTFKNKGADYYE